MRASDFIDGLSREQREAATHTSSPVMALAGAGSGKTRTLIGRFLHLVAPREEGGKGADPGSVMMVTFTNKAAREMRERIGEPLEELRQRTGDMGYGDPWIGTFHGLSLRILRIEADKAGLGKNFSIFDESDARSLLDEVTEDMGLEQFDADEFFRDLETAKARVLSPEFLARGKERVGAGGPDAGRWQGILGFFESQNFVDVYGRYQAALEEQNAVDFNDLLNRTTRLFQKNPEVRDAWRSMFRHFMVDEVQDINRAQVSWLHAITGGGEEMEVPASAKTSETGDASTGTHEINTYRLRAFPRPTIAFVGDDDQSIYAFRGSEVAVMRGLGDRFKGLETRMMRTSYRCQPSILEAANALVGKNTGRFGKDLYSHARAERLAPVRFQKKTDPSQEIDAIAREAEAFLTEGGDPNEFAVLVRTREINKAVARDLRARGLPVVEGKSSDIRKTMEVKDAMSFVTALTNPDAEVPLRRIVNKPSRGMGLTSMRKVGTNARIKDTSFLTELKTLFDGKVEVPDDGVPYPKRFLQAAKEFGQVLRTAQEEIRTAENGGDALLKVLDVTGYLPDLYHGALKSAGLADHEQETRAMSPRTFLSWLIRNGAERSEDGDGDLEGEELADRAGQLSEVARRIGNIALLVSEAEAFETLEDFAQESVLEMGQGAAPAGIQVMTMHAAKGLEFDHVRLPFWIEGVMPHSRAVMEASDEAIEEERRLAYVSLTRARKTLGVTQPVTVRGCPFIRAKSSDQSRFVREMATNGADVQFLKMRSGAGYLFAAQGSGKPFESLPEEPAHDPMPEPAGDVDMTPPLHAYEDMAGFEPDHGYGPDASEPRPAEDIDCPF